MPQTNPSSGTVIIIGASGQDGYFLTERLLAEGSTVHAATRRPEELSLLGQAPSSKGRLYVHAVNLLEPESLFDLIAQTRAEEIYNLAGQSSVSRSFADPILTWRTNAGFVARLLECVRTRSPQTRFYQASSTDMFGGGAGETILYHEDSALHPASPYASAKAAAHLLCRSYREAYNLRIACGILSNHESYRRPEGFLTRKITDHVRALRRLRAEGDGEAAAPLRMGNLKIRRDWGFAPDYVEGMRLILRQVSVRAARSRAADDAMGVEPAEPDEGISYRDYILGTGKTSAVWELVDTAFRIAGFTLEWHLEGDDPSRWHARFNATGEKAVVVNPSLLRPADPLVIQVDASRARTQLGWTPREGLEAFLEDMLGVTAGQAVCGELV